ncbi:lipoate--protein ligase family protein [Qipengyuania soli]|uniref:Lipoate--protein ligase family protein n=1 Tax=Qipengyuania soli TaxID=2782568 RepID=A0A7S8IUA8_9SPHN|nr:lipoate--protein ligase family protein [Qipengyuania soli]QPC98387.1 lipoate--protein ligase family protein [Qipengyuania soli]
MGAKFRVVDTGVRTGRENIALDKALIEARLAGDIGDTIRFIQFEPCALVGRHQDLAQELNLDACAARGVQTVRRMTGGGAIFMDGGQLGWALVCDKRVFGQVTLPDVTRLICEGIAAGLSKLGVDARFRPRNDIEIEGRKVSGTGGFFDGNILIFQGTVILDLDPAAMMAVLNVPQAKLEKRQLADAGARVTSLKAELGEMPSLNRVKMLLIEGLEETLGIETFAEELTEGEQTRANIAYAEEIGTQEFVEEICNPAREKDVLTGQNPARNLTAYVRVDGNQDSRIREVLFVGDVFVTPPRALLDLESHLRGTQLEDVERKTAEFFEGSGISMLGLEPRDFAAAVMDAACQPA